MRSSKNLFRHEIIGLDVKIIKSKNPSCTGIKGKVIDETRNTFMIEKSDGKEITIPKNDCVFSFYLPEENCWVNIDGKILISRPEDRIKKKFRRW
jgi:ribonuclease P protein subunit POP4